MLKFLNKNRLFFYQLQRQAGKRSVTNPVLHKTRILTSSPIQINAPDPHLPASFMEQREFNPSWKNRWMLTGVLSALFTGWYFKEHNLHSEASHKKISIQAIELNLKDRPHILLLDLSAYDLSYIPVEQLKFLVEKYSQLVRIIWPEDAKRLPAQIAIQEIEKILQNRISNSNKKISRPSDYWHVQCARLAYKDRKEIESILTTPHWEGWKLFDIQDDTNNRKSLNFSIALLHEASGHIIISHRGTHYFFRDFINANIPGVAFGKRTEREKDALAFAKKVADKAGQYRYSFSVTGHSLGGWLAQQCVYHLQSLKKERSYAGEIPIVITFDSPGAYEIMLQRESRKTPHLRIKLADLPILNYFSYGDLVNAFNHHVGIMYHIFPEIPGIDEKNKVLAEKLYDESLQELQEFQKNHPDTFQLHNIEYIAKCFSHEIGMPKLIWEMTTWPTINGDTLLKRYQEYWNKSDYLYSNKEEGFDWDFPDAYWLEDAFKPVGKGIVAGTYLHMWPKSVQLFLKECKKTSIDELLERCPTLPNKVKHELRHLLDSCELRSESKYEYLTHKNSVNINEVYRICHHLAWYLKVYPELNINKVLVRSGLDFNIIKEDLNDSQATLETIQDKKAILFLGNTRAGKSTLINYLMGRGVKKVVNPNNDEVIAELENVENEYDYPVAEHGLESVTFTPQAFPTKSGKLADYFYVDSTGIFENRGKEREIETSLKLQLAIEKASEVSSIMVIIERGSLYETGGHNLINLIETLANTLGGSNEALKNLNNIFSSMLFVITKKKTETKDHILYQIQNLIDIFNKNINDFEISPNGIGDINSCDESIVNDYNIRKLGVEILKHIQKNSDKLIMADVFDNGKTRNCIVEKLNVITKKDPVKKHFFSWDKFDKNRIEFDDIIKKELNIARVNIEKNKVLSDLLEKINQEKNEKSIKLQKCEHPVLVNKNSKLIEKENLKLATSLNELKKCKEKIIEFGNTLDTLTYQMKEAVVVTTGVALIAFLTANPPLAIFLVGFLGDKVKNDIKNNLKNEHENLENSIRESIKEIEELNKDNENYQRHELNNLEIEKIKLTNEIKDMDAKIARIIQEIKPLEDYFKKQADFFECINGFPTALGFDIILVKNFYESYGKKSPTPSPPQSNLGPHP